MSSGWGKFLLATVVGYALLVGLLYVSQRRLLYLPHPETPGAPASYGVPEMHRVGLATDDGLTLLAWYAPPAQGTRRPVLVLFHGNAGHIGYRAGKVRPFLDAGLGVLLVSYRGYGGNDGSPTEEGLYADGRAALRFLAGEGIASPRVVLYGESLGSGVAVLLASELARAAPVGAVVLEAPFTSMADAAALHYPYVPARRLVKDRYDSISRIADIGAPLLVIHGQADGIVPAEMGERLLAAARAPKEGHFVAGAGHNDLAEFDIATPVLEFLEHALSSM